MPELGNLLANWSLHCTCTDQWCIHEFLGGRVQQIQLRTERMGIWGQ